MPHSPSATFGGSENILLRTLCLSTALMLVGTTARAQRVAPPSATVGRDVATFVFPLDTDALYQPVAGGLQYGWRVRSGSRSLPVRDRDSRRCRIWLERPRPCQRPGSGKRLLAG